MAKILQNVYIDGRWITVERGAEVYGYDARHFHRLLTSGMVLGGTFDVEHWRWRSHPEGMVGPVADDRWQYFVLPHSTGGIHDRLCSGIISGAYYLETYLERQHPIFKVIAHPGCSGLNLGVRPIVSGGLPPQTLGAVL